MNLKPPVITDRGLFLFKVATTTCRGGNIFTASKLPAQRQENDDTRIPFVCEKVWIASVIMSECLVSITFFDRTGRREDSRVHGIEVAPFERETVGSKNNFCM